MERIDTKQASLECAAAHVKMTPLNVRTSLYISQGVEQADR